MRSSTRAALTGLITALALLCAAPAAAQVSQYTAPGSLLERAPSKREQMEQAVENARWRLGPLRLSPWIAVRDAAYVSDVFSGISEPVGGQEESDFTITMGAGLQGFVPLGAKSYFTLDALPQYVWWQEQDERRRLNGYYGVGLFGFFNRLTTQATVRRAEEQGVVTPEYEQRIHARQDRIEGGIEVEFAPSLFVFASAYTLETRALVDELEDDPRLPVFTDLDRDERVLRGGIELRFRERLRLAVGAERSEVEFPTFARDRSNSGTSPVLELSYGAPRLTLRGSFVRRSLEPGPGSEFVPFDETTGQLQATWTPRWRLSYSLYGNRSFTYSLNEGYSHFTADRLGLAVIAKLGHSSAVTLFAETGVHDYATSDPAAAHREDDFQAYGTSVQLQMRERVRLTLGVARTELDSNLPGLDRSLTVFRTGFEITAFGGAFTVR
jgi:hypothetical protein